MSSTEKENIEKAIPKNCTLCNKLTVCLPYKAITKTLKQHYENNPPIQAERLAELCNQYQNIKLLIQIGTILTDEGKGIWITIKYIPKLPTEK